LQQQPSDHLVTKHAFGAFINTDLDSHLRKSGATQVVFPRLGESGSTDDVLMLLNAR
jgi:isochorismate hydrolase